MSRSITVPSYSLCSPAVSSSTANRDDRREALGRYLSDLLEQDLVVREFERIEGGWSRQTHRVIATDEHGAELLLALRGEIDNSVLDTDLEREWLILRSVAG